MSEETLGSGKPNGDGKFSAGKLMRCHQAACEREADSFLESKFLCLTHFISYCYERLEECQTSPFGSVDSARAEADTRFLRDCCARAASLTPLVRDMDNLERARLFDIFLWASELLAKREAPKDEAASTRATPQK
jgi:hypothetical protein